MFLSLCLPWSQDFIALLRKWIQLWLLGNMALLLRSVSISLSLTQLHILLVGFPFRVYGKCKSPIDSSVFQHEYCSNYFTAATAAAKSLQSCPTLSDPMDCSLPGSSIHGIFQARVLEWVAIEVFPTFFNFSLNLAIRRVTLYSLYVLLSQFGAFCVTVNDAVLFFLWLSNIPLYIHTTSSLPISLSVDIYVTFASWPL